MNPNDPMPAEAFLLLNTLLTQKGWSLAQITTAIGTAPTGRTREQVADALRRWMHRKGAG